MADEGPPGQNQVPSRYWLAFGAIFSILIFGLLVAAFFSPDSSCDRWTLLRFVLPVFTGVAAGSFTGAINARGNVSQFAVAAGGGFAVWLISLLVIGVPDRCKVVNITHFRDFENAEAEGPPGTKWPKSLKPKQGLYDISNPDKFIFLFGVVISNIYIGAWRDIDLDVNVVGLGEHNEVVWSEPDHYDSLDIWRDKAIARTFTPAAIEAAMGVGDTSREGSFVLFWAVGCRTAKELAKWTGAMRIEVTDHGQRVGRVKTYLQLDKKDPQVAAMPDQQGAGGHSGCEAS